MPRDSIVRQATLRDLDSELPHPGHHDQGDEQFRDLRGQPVGDEHVVALARRIEQETGARIVFEPPRA